ncbi:MAG: hypothetical protein EA341_01500 [Mongoliibacter sp.]|nr:MAG: hypothetical protein EA341_01500 [Mongoliibacter sp.]
MTQDENIWESHNYSPHCIEDLFNAKNTPQKFLKINFKKPKGVYCSKTNLSQLLLFLHKLFIKIPPTRKVLLAEF